jgi:uncharacterized membrane-anchored protein
MIDQTIDLKKLERKVWTSFFEDGIWDIYLGLLLLAMGVGALVSDIGLSKTAHMIIYLLLVGGAGLFLWAGKRFITMPRVGRVIYGAKAKARKVKTIIVLTISVLVGLVAFVIAGLSAKGSLPQSLPAELLLPGIWVGNMLVVFSLAAYFLHFDRLYLIGVMFAICVPLDIVLKDLLHLDLTFIAFGLPAMVVLIIGFVVLARFLRKHSIPSADVPRSEV